MLLIKVIAIMNNIVLHPFETITVFFERVSGYFYHLVSKEEDANLKTIEAGVKVSIEGLVEDTQFNGRSVVLPVEEESGFGVTDAERYAGNSAFDFDEEETQDLDFSAQDGSFAAQTFDHFDPMPPSIQMQGSSAPSKSSSERTTNKQPGDLTRDRWFSHMDATAICQRFGRPHLYITMTCNPKWPEIQPRLKKRHRHEDKLDVQCIKYILKYIKKDTDVARSVENDDAAVEGEGEKPRNEVSEFKSKRCVNSVEAC